MMRRTIDSFEVWANNQRVDPAQAIPPDCQEVEFRWNPDRPEGQASPPRPSQARASDDPPDDEPGDEAPRDQQRGFDADALYLDYPGPRGELLRLELGIVGLRLPQKLGGYLSGGS